jgi:hypothetical protein
MKWFSRKPKPPSGPEIVRDTCDPNPGEWQPFPDNLAIGRKALLLYDVIGETDGTVWIRKKPNA